MWTRCLICSTPLPANETLDHLPHGERFAYDPARGRLWVICRPCRRWNLTPIEARWEALEELEKHSTDVGRLLTQTDNIALIRAGPIEIVRVGRARLAEEAWWRYGRELMQRREQFRKISFAGAVAVGAAAVGGWATGGFGLIGAWWLWSYAPGKVPEAARWLRFGGTAWRGHARCERCGTPVRSLRYRDRGELMLRPGAEPGGVQVMRRCPFCRARGASGLLLEGGEAERTLRRILAYHHFSGASERRLARATGLIESAGSAEHFTANVIGRGRLLGEVHRDQLIGFEIAANEALEKRLLELELAELEAEWRREEELGAIVDGELTPMPLLETLRRRVAGQRGAGPDAPLNSG